MSPESIAAIAVAVALGGLLLALGVMALRAIETWRKKTVTPGANPGDPDVIKPLDPNIDAILTALVPWIHTGILAGQKAVMWGLDEVNATLDGLDKKAIADAMYDLLPPTLMIGPVPIPIGQVKSLITREAFESQVENVYREADAFIMRNKDFLSKQVDAFENPPDSVVKNSFIEETGKLPSVVVSSEAVG